MAKTRLTLDFSYDFLLVGLSCHQKDYRLCWAINRALELDLSRKDDVILADASGQQSRYSFYSYSDEVHHLKYYVVSNRGGQGYLVPECKEADYFLVIDGHHEYLDMQDALRQLKQCDVVLTAFEIDPDGLKSKENLVFE